jgi:Na+/melibiose symporter-like transporter
MDMTENYILFVIIRLSGDIFLLLIFYPYCQSILIDRIQSQFLGSQRSLATSFRRTIAVAPAYLVCALPVTFSNFLQQLPAIFPKFTIAIRLANLPMMFILLAALLAGPIYLAERTSPHEALERSAELTSGRRIKIFLALLIVNLLLGFVLISLSKIPILFMNSTADLTASYFQFISITSTIVMLLGGIAYSSLLAVIYCMLQREKKGLGAGEVISVFE